MGKNSSDLTKTDTETVLSIIIVNYMTRDYLQACLASIMRECDIAYEVLVVDNGSTDGSTEMVETNFPSVRIIRNNVNIGFAKANNIGIEHSAGKYILLLNPDTELTGSTLKIMVYFMEEFPDVSAAGCKIIYPDGRLQFSCGYIPTIESALWGGQTFQKIFRKILPESNLPGACGIDPETLGTKCEVETLLGACVIIRKEVFDKIGMFDENMFLYFEECDLFFRIKKTGGKIIYMPDTAVIHHAGGSSSKSLENSVNHYQKSQEYFFRKNFALRKIKLFRILVMISSIIKSATLSLIYVFSRKNKSAELKRKIAWHWYSFLYYVKWLCFRTTP